MLPTLLPVYALIVHPVNVYDGTKIGSKIVGSIQPGARVAVVDFAVEDGGRIFANIGGNPFQWIVAWQGDKKHIKFELEG